MNFIMLVQRPTVEESISKLDVYRSAQLNAYSACDLINGFHRYLYLISQHCCRQLSFIRIHDNIVNVLFDNELGALQIPFPNWMDFFSSLFFNYNHYRQSLYIDMVLFLGNDSYYFLWSEGELYNRIWASSPL